MQNYEASANLLRDRVILVTGASSGIGRQVARSYAQRGATVILLARSVNKLESLYDEIESSLAPTPAIYPFDLANATLKSYEELKEKIEQHFGKLDGILHNAAYLGSLTPIEHTSIEQWYRVLQVNLNSSFLLTQAVLPLLKCSKDASIIFTTADVGEQAKAYFGAYAVSKAAIKAFMQILADELQANTSVRVNCINPGTVRTKLRASAYPAEEGQFLTDPEQLLPLYLYLMGPDSANLTGQTMKPTQEFYHI